MLSIRSPSPVALSHENNSPRWPSSAKNEEEYWAILDSYKGECIEVGEGYVEEIFHDEEVNKLSGRIFCKGPSGEAIDVSRQLAVDLRRNSTIIFNDEETFRNGANSDPVETAMAHWSEEERIAVTLSHCVADCHNDPHLTLNILKLSTQASIATICHKMIERFSLLTETGESVIHPFHEKSQAHWIEVETVKSPVVTIALHSLWEIVSPTLGEKKVKYFKGVTKFFIEGDRLRRGDCTGALCIEIISPPFDKLEEEALFSGKWPNSSDCKELYDVKLRSFPPYAEKLLACDLNMIREYLCIDAKIASEASIANAIFSREFPLLAVVYNGDYLFDREKGATSLKLPPGNINISQLTALITVTLPFLLKKRVYERFAAASIGRLVSSDGYRVVATEEGKKSIKIELSSQWYSRDGATKEKILPKIDTFFAKVSATIVEEELVEAIYEVRRQC